MKGEARFSSGFTLIEVLIAFAILAGGLILAAAELSRHLFALQFLESSVMAQHQADRQLIGEILRREENVSIPGLDAVGTSVPRVSLQQFSWDQEPLKGFEIDQATVEVPWKVRGRIQITRMTSGFQRRER